MELVRLALPRRTHTQSHIDYVIEVMKEIFKSKSKLAGYRLKNNHLFYDILPQTLKKQPKEKSLIIFRIIFRFLEFE